MPKLVSAVYKYRTNSSTKQYPNETMALVKIGVAASRLGLSTKQLRTLDKKGLIKTVRTEGKTRLFDVNGYVAKLESDKINETLSGLVVAHASCDGGGHHYRDSEPQFHVIAGSGYDHAKLYSTCH